MSESSPARTFGWRSLLLAAGLTTVILLMATGAAVPDRESLALGGLVLAATALLRYRSGLLGALCLGLLFADIAFWMLPSAASNVMHGEGLIELLLPGSLAALSLLGLVAAVASITSGMSHRAGASAAAPVTLGALAVLLALVVTAQLVGRRQESKPGAGTLVLRAENMAFSETKISARRGNVIVYLSNEDLFWHTFTIDALGVDLRAPVGGERQTTFRARPGTYEFYCRIPGHDLAGMRGTLVVR